MSARIAPEPVSIAVSPAAQFAPKQNQQPTRPIESAGSTSADPGSNNAFGRKLSDGDKARPGDRPPGKDPAMLPQALFDAALIASEYKPTTAPVEVETEYSAQPLEQPETETDTQIAAAQLAERIIVNEARNNAPSSVELKQASESDDDNQTESAAA